MDFNLVLFMLYALWGMTVGLMVGFTAIGTGLIGTPGLMLLFGLDPVIAVGTMGFGGFIMMSSGVLQHYKEKNIEWRIAGIFSITAVPVSFFCARYADAINEVIPLRMIIGIIIVISAVLLFYRYVILKPQPRALEITKAKLVMAPFLGLLMGALMGATSISGSIIVITFLFVLKLPSTIAIGTTAAVSAASLAIAAISHGMAGHIDWVALTGLVPGMILGSTIGAKYVKKVPRDLLRYTIIIILVAAGVMVLLK